MSDLVNYKKTIQNMLNLGAIAWFVGAICIVMMMAPAGAVTGLGVYFMGGEPPTDIVSPNSGYYNLTPTFNSSAEISYLCTDNTPIVRAYQYFPHTDAWWDDGRNVWVNGTVSWTTITNRNVYVWNTTASPTITGVHEALTCQDSGYTISRTYYWQTFVRSDRLYNVTPPAQYESLVVNVKDNETSLPINSAYVQYAVTSNSEIAGYTDSFGNITFDMILSDGLIHGVETGAENYFGESSTFTPNHAANTTTVLNVRLTHYGVVTPTPTVTPMVNVTTISTLSTIPTGIGEIINKTSYRSGIQDSAVGNLTAGYLDTVDNLGNDVKNLGLAVVALLVLPFSYITPPIVYALTLTTDSIVSFASLGRWVLVAMGKMISGLPLEWQGLITLGLVFQTLLLAIKGRAGVT